MKKIIYFLLSLAIIGPASFAQNSNDKKVQSAPKSAAQRTPTRVQPNAIPAANTSAAGKVQQTGAAKTNASVSQSTSGSVKTKKDGTPDMRYKENQQSAVPAAKLKKDGTPDKRYKANSSANVNAVKKN